MWARQGSNLRPKDYESRPEPSPWVLQRPPPSAYVLVKCPFAAGARDGLPPGRNRWDGNFGPPLGRR